MKRYSLGTVVASCVRELKIDMYVWHQNLNTKIELDGGFEAMRDSWHSTLRRHMKCIRQVGSIGVILYQVWHRRSSWHAAVGSTSRITAEIWYTKRILKPIILPWPVYKSISLQSLNNWLTSAFWRAGIWSSFFLTIWSWDLTMSMVGVCVTFKKGKVWGNKAMCSLCRR